MDDRIVAMLIIGLIAVCAQGLAMLGSWIIGTPESAHWVTEAMNVGINAISAVAGMAVGKALSNGQKVGPEP